MAMSTMPNGTDRIPEPITLWWLMNRSGQPLSLPDQIAARIAEQLITGAIPPGARITEQTISGDFEVSRAPVREALRILERQHLIEIHPRKGARATRLTREDVRDISEIRQALYRVIAERLAGQGNPDAIMRLESKANDLLAFAEDQRGPDRYLWGALDLSICMAEESGNAHIAGILGGLALQTYRYARLSAVSLPQRQRTARMWRDSVRAMKRLDAQGAADILGRIAIFARDQSIQYLDKLEDAASDDDPDVESGQ